VTTYATAPNRQGFEEFHLGLSPRQAWGVNLDLASQIEINVTQVRIMPDYELIDDWRKWTIIPAIQHL